MHSLNMVLILLQGLELSDASERHHHHHLLLHIDAETLLIML